jgi:hypothetical protein
VIGLEKNNIKDAYDYARLIGDAHTKSIYHGLSIGGQPLRPVWPKGIFNQEDRLFLSTATPTTKAALVKAIGCHSRIVNKWVAKHRSAIETTTVKTDKGLCSAYQWTDAVLIEYACMIERPRKYSRTKFSLTTLRTKIAKAKARHIIAENFARILKGPPSIANF